MSGVEIPRTCLIRVGSDILASFGTRTESGERITAELGDPTGYCPDSGEYIYEPTFRTTYDPEWAKAGRWSDRAYTLLVSSIPALYRAFRDSPNPTAAHLNDDLLRYAIDWVQAFQRDTGRTVDDFSEYGYPA